MLRENKEYIRTGCEEYFQRYERTDCKVELKALQEECNCYTFGQTYIISCNENFIYILQLMASRFYINLVKCKKLRCLRVYVIIQGELNMRLCIESLFYKKEAQNWEYYEMFHRLVVCFEKDSYNYLLRR